MVDWEKQPMFNEGINTIIKSRSRTFLAFCFSFIMGVSLFSIDLGLADGQFYLYVFLFLILFFLIILWHKLIVRFVFICILFFVIGGLRFYWSVPSFEADKLIYYNGHTVDMVGRVSQEVMIKENNTQAVVSVVTVGAKKVTGKVLLFLPPYADLKFGDRVRTNCQLKKPIGSDSFINYDKYLARDGIRSQCNWPKLEKLPYDPSWLEKVIIKFYNFKSQIQTQVDKLWVEPESTLMAGLLYGARSGFSPEVNNDFSRVGITHIVAISGYNISVVASILIGLLLAVGLKRRRAFWLAILGIGLFVLFTGASASVVRAGVMGVIVLLAGQLGRLSRIGNVLVFTAAVMLLFNPFVLVWDAGFQLSFLSTVGLIYLSPILTGYFKLDHKNIFIKSLLESLITTISAIIVTLPLILFQFGRLSLVAPLANLLIVWSVPYLMLVGFGAIILSVVFFPLGQLVVWVAYLGLKYVIIMAHYLASWPLASVNFSVSLWVMVGLYLLIILCMSRVKILNSTVGYDLAALDYDKKEKYLNSFEQNKILPLFGEVKGKKILDVGAGTGRLALILGNAGAQVTALDVSVEMLKMLAKKNSKIETVVGEAEDLPFKDNIFDFVTATFLIVHLKNPTAFFDEAYRVLKDDGRLIITNINQKEAPEVKTKQGNIKIESYYHRPEKIIEELENLAFKIEKNIFVYENDICINQIIVAGK